MKIELRIEVLSFGDLETIWWLEMIACHDIVDVVDSSGSEPNLGEISWPDSSICILSLILREIWSIDVIVDVSESTKMNLSLSSHSW